MKVRNRRLALTLLFVLVSATQVWPQEASDTPSTLLRQLQSNVMTDKAKVALLKRAQTDLEVRRYLAANLPTIIETGGKKPTSGWLNAVRLAGELRISEAAPALASCIAVDNMGGEITAGGVRHLETIPAAKALAQIGDPAIPTLVDVLDRGTQRERRNAYLTLNLIGSKLSMATLRAQLEKEPEQSLRNYIESEMATLHRNEKPTQ